MPEYIIWSDGKLPEKDFQRITRCRFCSYFIEERGCCDYRKPFMFTVNPSGFCDNAKEKE